ncbi:MAG: L,D-transpeptidase [Prochlorococcaceae cyanobacterium]
MIQLRFSPVARRVAPRSLAALLLAAAALGPWIAPAAKAKAAEALDSAPPTPEFAPPELALPQRRLVLERQQRRLLVFENGQELKRFPVAVGMPGWETPVGEFSVIELAANPVWEHPAEGHLVPPGPGNPLGSRWIGFHRDCKGRRGFNGQQHLEVKGCVTAGFHGTNNRDSVGRAVSHGCVRLYDEDVRALFDLVQLGTPVTVLP